MAIYFVAKTGNDSNAGTSVSAPKLTIDSAWLATSTGDSIIILDSETYAGGSNYELSNRNITELTVQGDDGTYTNTTQNPTIDGETGAGWFMYVRGTSGSGWTFRNLKFIRFNSTAGEGILRYGTGISQTLLIEDCEFSDSIGRTLALAGATTLTLSRCKFFDINGVTSGDNGIVGFAAQNTNISTIKNCLFYNLGPRMANGSFRVIGAGSRLNNSNSVVSHCTIAKRNTTVSNAATPTHLIDIGPGTVEHCLIYNFDVTDTSGATINGTSAATVRYNTYGSTDITWSGSEGPLKGSGTETGNVLLTGDPGFVDYEKNDYRLTVAARSIAVDVSSGSTETVDITNTLRSELDRLAYNSGLNDNGCYETSFWTPSPT